MHFAIVLADDIGSQLYHWIFSAVFSQSLVTFLFAFMFPITSAAIINYLERKVMAGWGSNNKYSLIGGLRAAAQMISYELPLVLALAGVVMLTSVLAGSPGYPGNTGIGTISIKEVMTFQNTWKDTGIGILDFIFKGFTPWAWFILVQPLMLLICTGKTH